MFRKICAGILTLLILISSTILIVDITTNFVSAGEPFSGSYRLINNGTTAEITDYAGSGGAVVIPKTIDGYPVTSICYRALENHVSITSITIPDSITNIGTQAFLYCVALTSINVDSNNPYYASVNGVLYNKGITTLIEWPAGKTTVTIPESVTSIGDFAFSGCISITSVTIGNRVTSIGHNAFESCTSLSFVWIVGSGATRIGDNAFSDCTSLTSITIGSGVTSIGDFAFEYCTSLTSITIGSGVTSIGYFAFYYCTSLTAVIFDGHAPAAGDSWAFGPFYLDNYLIAYYHVGASGFSTPSWHGVPCYPLTSTPSAPNIAVVAGENQVTVSWTAPIYTGDSAIDYYVVYKGGIQVATSSGSSATVNGLTDGQTYSFRVAAHNSYGIGTGSMTMYIELPFVSNGFSYAVLDEGSATITGYIGPGGAVVVPSYIFDLPVTIIGTAAFSDCTSLTSITIPDSVMSIEDNAFSDCTSLTSITIGSSVTSIGNNAFSDCTSLASITIPDSVTSIGDNAFYDCYRLTSITIGSGLSTIGSGMFEYCTSLASITIGSGVTSIGVGTFFGCALLASINIDSDNPNYASIGGVLFNKEVTTLITYPMARAGASYIMPDGVNHIGEYGFYDCTYLTSLIFNGNAPSVSVHWAEGSDGGLTAYYLYGATGFTIPTWQGIPCHPFPSTPLAPGGLTANAGNGTVVLSWTAPDHDDGLVIDHYIIYQDEVRMAISTTTSATITGLTNGQPYVFKIAAHNEYGDGTNSSSVSATPYINKIAVTIIAPFSSEYLKNANVTVNWNTVADLSIVSTEISLDGTTWTDVIGSSYELNSLSDGLHTFSVKETDSDSNVKTESVSFYVDTIAPTLTIVTPKKGFLNNTGNVTATWVAIDASGITRTEVSIDVMTWSPVFGTSYELHSLSDGAHTINVKLTDRAGNIKIASSTFFVDTTASAITYLSPIGGDILLDTTLDVEFSETMNAASVTIAVSNNVEGSMVFVDKTATFTPSLNLSYNTTYTVIVSGKDMAGNSVQMEWTFSTLKDEGTIDGTIENGRGNPIVNALATLSDGKIVMTDPYGSVQFYNVTSGSYTLKLEKNEYENITFDVTVIAGRTTFFGVKTMAATSSEDTPDDDAPVDEDPSEDTPDDDAPVDEDPSEDTPDDDAPVDEDPSEDTPDDDAPVDEDPSEENPGGNASAPIPNYDTPLLAASVIAFAAIATTGGLFYMRRRPKTP